VLDLGVASGQQRHSQVAVLNIDGSCTCMACTVLHGVCRSTWLSWMERVVA
jgi:hypothetical protein